VVSRQNTDIDTERHEPARDLFGVLDTTVGGRHARTSSRLSPTPGTRAFLWTGAGSDDERAPKK
jgi:hypothetical protein